ncbi:PilT domain-containing protein [Dyadobacter fermentans DSM 18053]|uniref:PilT domain-containing protein n=1 Tax=Dyadobacter fermentans (strain ATCC 700827 / DSM 18053 / CIP 107007 / KCTC 52180 / NS114) TaxID=471854 RepID=C6W5W3_DYAFD|nr:PilT domain-containing protein [Dyadobacter fermentans DSM 18053]
MISMNRWTIWKLVLPDPIESIFEKAIENQIKTIHLSPPQLTAYQALPFFEDHRDPFDRLIIATALKDSLSIISNDPKFPLYPAAQIIW